MTPAAPVQPEPDVLPPELPGALSVPPPVPQKKPGFLRRLFTSRKKQQAVAIQNGYLEMVDLIRAIRSHLDRQETVQTGVLSMLKKVPDAMDRQHEVMTMFKQQLENGMENNRRLTDSMGNLNNTLSAMDESQKASSRTITDLIHRSRESEQLLREVMRRSERRMTALVIFFFLAVVALGFYFVRGRDRSVPVPEAVAAETGKAKTAPAKPVFGENRADEPVAEKAEFIVPAKKEKSPKKSKIKPETDPVEPATTVPAAPALGQPDLTLDQIKPVIEDDSPAADKPVSIP